MRLWKNRPDCSPIHFGQKIISQLLPLEKVAKNLDTFENFQKSCPNLERSGKFGDKNLYAYATCARHFFFLKAQNP
jgi:hypothetical protein